MRYDLVTSLNNLHDKPRINLKFNGEDQTSSYDYTNVQNCNERIIDGL